MTVGREVSYREHNGPPLRDVVFGIGVLESVVDRGTLFEAGSVSALSGLVFFIPTILFHTLSTCLFLLSRPYEYSGQSDPQRYSPTPVKNTLPFHPAVLRSPAGPDGPDVWVFPFWASGPYYRNWTGLQDGSHSTGKQPPDERQPPFQPLCFMDGLVFAEKGEGTPQRCKEIAAYPSQTTLGNPAKLPYACPWLR